MNSRLILLFGIALFVFISGCTISTTPSVCGNGICEENENSSSCSADCGTSTGGGGGSEGPSFDTSVYEQIELPKEIVDNEALGESTDEIIGQNAANTEAEITAGTGLVTASAYLQQPPVPPPTCNNNGICEYDESNYETYSSCPADCGSPLFSFYPYPPEGYKIYEKDFSQDELDFLLIVAARRPVDPITKQPLDEADKDFKVAGISLYLYSADDPKRTELPLSGDRTAYVSGDSPECLPVDNPASPCKQIYPYSFEVGTDYKVRVDYYVAVYKLRVPKSKLLVGPNVLRFAPYVNWEDAASPSGRWYKQIADVYRTVEYYKNEKCTESCINTIADYYAKPYSDSEVQKILKFKEPAVGSCANEIAGDIDNSGAVDAVDVQRVINVALGVATVADNPCADVDGNGFVTAVDVQLVINAALGIAPVCSSDPDCDDGNPITTDNCYNANTYRSFCYSYNPTDLCWNNVCDSGETFESCPRDCDPPIQSCAFNETNGISCQKYEVCDGSVIDQESRCCFGVCKLPSEFDWRNRHGENFNTPVKNQGGVSSCTSFGAIASIESAINAYYNQHLDVDLSEQATLSCAAEVFYDGEGSECNSQNVSTQHICNATVYGQLEESCYPYVDHITQDTFICNNLCENYLNRFWKVDDYIGLESTHYFVPPSSTLYNSKIELINEKKLKKSIVQYGPVTVVGEGFIPGHSVSIVGWNTNTDESTIAIGIVKTPIYPPANQDSLISCTNKDLDNYCNWGIADIPKPEYCPTNCLSNQKDWNDADNGIGALGIFE